MEKLRAFVGTTSKTRASRFRRRDGRRRREPRTATAHPTSSATRRPGAAAGHRQRPPPLALNDYVETFLPVVAPGGQNDIRIGPRLTAFCSPAPVQSRRRIEEDRKRRGADMRPAVGAHPWRSKRARQPLVPSDLGPRGRRGPRFAELCVESEVGFMRCSNRKFALIRSTTLPNEPETMHGRP